VIRKLDPTTGHVSERDDMSLRALVAQVLPRLTDSVTGTRDGANVYTFDRDGFRRFCRAVEFELWQSRAELALDTGALTRHLAGHLWPKDAQQPVPTDASMLNALVNAGAAMAGLDEPPYATSNIAGSFRHLTAEELVLQLRCMRKLSWDAPFWGRSETPVEDTAILEATVSLQPALLRRALERCPHSPVLTRASSRLQSSPPYYCAQFLLRYAEEENTGREFAEVVSCMTMLLDRGATFDAGVHAKPVAQLLLDADWGEFSDRVSSLREVFRSLIRHGHVGVNAVLTLDNAPYHPLYVAIEAGNIPALEVLLQEGADVIQVALDAGYDDPIEYMSDLPYKYAAQAKAVVTAHLLAKALQGGPAATSSLAARPRRAGV